MKRNLGLTITMILAVILAACGQAAPVAAPQGEAGPLKIGVANFSQCCPYFIGMNDAVVEEAKPFSNITIISTDANGDAAKFQSDIEDLIAQGIDGIIVSGAWLEEAPAALDALAAEGIPTVLVDRQFGKGSASAYTSYIGPDNFTIGVQDGQYIADRLGGEGVVVQLRGGPADNSIGLNRSNGMLSVLETFPDITVITAPDFGGWSADGGIALMEDLLASNPQIDAVFCENDSMCLGAQTAIADAGRADEMFLVGVDGENAALEAIINGTNYAATGLNNSDQIGRGAFNRLMSILGGGTPEKDTYLPSPLITEDNVLQHYNPEGTF
ncbi:MAG: Sugar transporter substrate-binding protein [Anaerolineales bacterium]|jgi:ribose transport system substrate-binding protein|nr:Sugar transporter substrate-binding protein [Anaerolineales bacterium]